MNSAGLGSIARFLRQYAAVAACAGIALGVGARLTMRAIARVSPTALWPGVATGAVMFTVLAAMPPASAQSALAGTPDPPLATGLLFLGLCLAFGAACEWCWRRVRRTRR